MFGAAQLSVAEVALIVISVALWIKVEFFGDRHE